MHEVVPGGGSDADARRGVSSPVHPARQAYCCCCGTLPDAIIVKANDYLYRYGFYSSELITS